MRIALIFLLIVLYRSELAYSQDGRFNDLQEALQMPDSVLILDFIPEP